MHQHETWHAVSHYGCLCVMSKACHATNPTIQHLKQPVAATAQLPHLRLAASSASGRCICTEGLGGGGSTLPYSVKGLSEIAPSTILLLTPELRPAAAAAACARACASASFALLIVLATLLGLAGLSLAAALAARIF